MKNFTVLTILLLVSLPVKSALYRWVDAEGKVHYGDKIPPKVAQNGHTKLHKNGTTKEKVESAAVRKRKLLELIEERKQQELLKEAKRKEDLQEMHDTQLMSMFNSTKELKNVYLSKLKLADDSINVLKARHKKLSGRLEKAEARHERMVNPADKRQLGMKISDMLDNLHVYQQAITENLIERDEIETRFEKDLARYKLITKKNAAEQ